MQKQLPQEIRSWLNNRGISDAVIQTYGIHFENNKVVIPVRDREGNFLFNKYRRNPSSDEGPKYQYDKGASSILFGLREFDKRLPIFICEGELDALLLSSMEFQAVSTTGGSGTFDEEWFKYFEGFDTFICYDNDEAGIKGSFTVQKVIPHARIMWLPNEVGEHGDVTDYFIKLKKNTNDFVLLAERSVSHHPPIDWKSGESKKELRKMEQHYIGGLNSLVLEARLFREQRRSDRPIQKLIEMYGNKLQEVRRAIKYFDKPKMSGGDKIARAKVVPIPMFIKFNSEGNAPCVWHKEDTPSMHYNDERSKYPNTVKCFGCDKMGDVIDFIQAQRGVTLSEALNIILK